MTIHRDLFLTNPYLTGQDVREAQTLLNRHGFGAGAVDGVYGPVTAAAAWLAKWTLGYPMDAVDEVFGPILDGYLSGLTRLPADDRQRAALRTRLRGRVVEWWGWAIDNQELIHYMQSRPMPIGRMRAKLLPFSTDCSGAFTGAYAFAGTADPNGPRYSFNGYGYTGTLLANGLRVESAAGLLPGDGIVYGINRDEPGGHHVVTVLEAGPDPVVGSHGHEAGSSPELTRHSRILPGMPRGETAFLRFLPRPVPLSVEFE